MIRNQTKGETIVSKQKLLIRLLKQAFGLMFRRRLVDTGWVFIFSRPARWDLTNLFVFQDIDALWLDVDRRVLQKQTISSWAIRCRGHQGSWYVIELPAGAAQGVEVGDLIVWDEKAL